MRILFMIPIYSTVSFLSYVYYLHAIYFEVLRDCYEAFAIASFFTLLCNYVAPSLHDQKEYFRSITPKNWFLQFYGLQKCTGGEHKGPFRNPRSGLTWFNVGGESSSVSLRVFADASRPDHIPRYFPVLPDPRCLYHCLGCDAIL